jgi:hypothetical protein
MQVLHSIQEAYTGYNNHADKYCFSYRLDLLLFLRDAQLDNLLSELCNRSTDQPREQESVPTNVRHYTLKAYSNRKFSVINWSRFTGFISLSAVSFQAFYVTFHQINLILT